MPIALIVPDQYGYVLAVAALSSTVQFTHILLTSRRRKAAKVPYPNAYASAEEAEKSLEKLSFNCAQRAHANFLESYPTFLVSLVISGLQLPVASAGLGAAWIVARLMYAYGYTRPTLEAAKNGKGRLIGAWGTPVLLGLIGTSFYSAAQYVL